MLGYYIRSDYLGVDFMIKHKEMLFADFPKIGEITSTVKEQNKKRVFTGGVRIGNGMYRTDAEMAKYRSEALKKKLP